MAPKMPPELWLQAFEHLDPYTLLGSAKRICRALYPLASTFHLVYGLTPEIWLKIWGDYLDYHHLKQLMRTCETFRRLLTNCRTPALDARLFRERPSESKFDFNKIKTSGGLRSRDLQIHHIFNILEIQDLRGYDNWEQKPASTSLTDLEDYRLRRRVFDCMGDNATSPPLTKAYLDFREVFFWVPRDIYKSRISDLLIEIGHSHDDQQQQKSVLVSDILEGCSRLMSFVLDPRSKEPEKHERYKEDITCYSSLESHSTDTLFGFRAVLENKSGESQDTAVIWDPDIHFKPNFF
ncbi:hypothetical protein TWF281_002876 [Arthrobotrys megalospora]